MANLSDYTTGTVSVAANGTVVTGVGTSWATLPAFKEGDWFIANGWVNIVQSVDSNTQLTLAMPWRGGALTAQPYRLRYMSDGSRTSAMTKALLELLGGSGSLEALAILSGLPDHIPMFTGPGVMTLIPRSDLINGVKFDVQVNTLAERAAYNGQPAGFIVLVSDNGDGRSAIYTRIGAAGNWSAPAFLTGPQGSANFVGTSTTSVASSTGNKTFTIVEPSRSWGVGQRLRASRTATPTQFVEGVVVSYTGNTLVLNVLIFNGTGSHASWTINPVGEPGSIAGVTAFWNTRISTDTTESQARAGLDVYSKNESGVLAGFRNKVINGSFDVWQRGTSFTHSAGGHKFDADRVTANFNGTGTMTVSRLTLPPTTPIPGHPTYCRRCVINNQAGGTYNNFYNTNIEDVRTLANSKATLTFYAKISSGVQPLNAFVRQLFGTGGSPLVTIGMGARDVNTSWQKFQYVFDLPEIGSKTITDDSTLNIILQLPPNTPVTIDHTKISLVEGDATSELDPFSPRQIQQEIDLCLRYFETSSSSEYSTSPTNTVRHKVRFMVPKRVTPTVSFRGNVTPTSLTITNPAVDGFRVNTGTGTAGGLVEFNWDADAEW